jgi:hypothetical protein
MCTVSARYEAAGILKLVTSIYSAAESELKPRSLPGIGLAESKSYPVVVGVLGR